MSKLLILCGLLSLELFSSPQIDYPEVLKLQKFYAHLPKKVLEDIKNILYSFDQYKKLPSKYITKEKACDLNWLSRFCKKAKERCNLSKVAPNKSIGGNAFRNTYGFPPALYYAADLGGLNKNKCRNMYRLIYSKDFLHIYFSADHYASFVTLR